MQTAKNLQLATFCAIVPHMPHASYAERIQQARPRLSKSFKRLADYILDSYIQAALMTTSELAHEVDVDAATVVRFAQALDYSGFPEMQDEIKARVLEDLHLRPLEVQDPKSLWGRADQALRDLSESIERSRRLLDPAAFEALSEVLGNAKRVLLLPDESAFAVISLFAQQLEPIGIQARVTDPVHGSLASALAATGAGEVVLVVDLEGESPLLSESLAMAKNFALATAAIVGGASFETARRAEIVLEIHAQDQADEARVVLAAILEALSSALQWKYAERYKQHQAKARRARKRMVGKSA